MYGTSRAQPCSDGLDTRSPSEVAQMGGSDSFGFLVWLFEGVACSVLFDNKRGRGMRGRAREIMRMGIELIGAS